MNKKVPLILAVVIGVALLGGGVFAFTSSQNSEENQAEKLAMEKEAMEKEAMLKEDSMEKEDAAMSKDEAMMDGEAMKKHGSYVTLTDYTSDTQKYADSKKVYFFHASWCPICQGIDKEINADITKIPAGVVFIKTDFDSNTALRQKYGVTTQYTFVQVDNDGNETAQWSATNLDKAVAAIKS